MKCPLFILLLLFSGIFVLPAQEAAKEEITPQESAKKLSEAIAQKLALTKSQKDSLATIFVRFVEDIAKYNAENNAKVITYFQKARDEKVKALLHDDKKYEKYQLLFEDIRKQRPPQQQAPQQKPMQQPMQQLNPGSYGRSS
jgi:hypothetical protein